MARPRFDPEHARLVEPDAAGVLIPDARLDAEALRHFFTRDTGSLDAIARAASPDPADSRPLPTAAELAALTPAAVLVGLVQRPAGLTVLLTRRTAHLNDHAGQISFPGGRTDPDDTSPVATALREAHEEVGLAPGAVEVIGRLPLHDTSTGFLVTPVVALIEPVEAFAPEPFEVAEVFETPLAFLMDPRNHELREVAWNEGGVAMTRRFRAMPWHSGGERYFIWGATAAMLHSLYRLLASGAD